jgi:hypothetical protein
LNIIVISTEEWKTKQGIVVKAVARNEKGHLLGATNQTAAVAPVVVGRK